MKSLFSLVTAAVENWLTGSAPVASAAATRELGYDHYVRSNRQAPTPKASASAG